MDTKALQADVDKDIRERAERLAREKVTALTLRRRKLKAVYDRTKKMIIETDKEIAEVKVEDFEERALSDVARRNLRGEMWVNWNFRGRR